MESPRSASPPAYFCTQSSKASSPSTSGSWSLSQQVPLTSSFSGTFAEALERGLSGLSSPPQPARMPNRTERSTPRTSRLARVVIRSPSPSEERSNASDQRVGLSCPPARRGHLVCVTRVAHVADLDHRGRHVRQVQGAEIVADIQAGALARVVRGG